MGRVCLFGPQGRLAPCDILAACGQVRAAADARWACGRLFADRAPRPSHMVRAVSTPQASQGRLPAAAYAAKGKGCGRIPPAV